jgi:hypothetical protein
MLLPLKDRFDIASIAAALNRIVEKNTKPP